LSRNSTVFLVSPVYRICLAQSNTPDRPNRPDRPNEPNKQASWAGFSSFLLAIVILGITSMAHAQFGGSCRASAPPSRASGTGSFEVVPSLCVAERYDSNVFFRPATPGLQGHDFVTTVNPRVLVNHSGEYASGVLSLGGFSETYAKNTNLNYLGTNDSLFLNLDNSIKRLFPHASLRIMDTFSYTQLPPGMVNPIAGKRPSDPNIIVDPNIPNSDNVFAQGLQFQRSKNLINTGAVMTSYATTNLTSLSASYSYSILRFNGASSTQGLTLLDTTTQTGTVGGTARVSDLDTLNITYSQGQTESTRGATSSFFKVDTATLGWSRLLTSSLSAQVGGGGTLISSGYTTYIANASLVMNFVNSSATMSYARSVVPSFVGAGEPLIADRFSLSAVQKLSRQWQVTESGGYVHTTRAGGVSALTYDSIVAGGDIQYWANSIWGTSLSYNYMKFISEPGSVKTDFDRHVVMFSVIANWN
jgi:hypothetical protein